jgi:hypothetical protein
MSFPVTTGVLLPADIDKVHRAFHEVSNEPWFTRDPNWREQFALLVIDAYRQGHTDPSDLTEYCREIALQQFGNSAYPRDSNPSTLSR